MAPSITAGTSTSRSGCGAVIQVVNSARRPSASDWPASRSMNGSRSDTASARISSTRAGRGAESGQRLERLQRHQQLGLVAAVAVVADRRGHRNAQAVLARETLDRLLGARVGLQRQRFVGREHLDQERQRVAEAARAPPAPSCPSGSSRHASEQRVLALVRLQPGRVARVRAEPQLGLRMRCRDWPSGEFGDGGARTPGVGPHRSA